ncbi:group I intron-associated PD-(D/E)XK endonuclease [Clostridium botulinum]|uniref:group I intron-associated PD-(D/E)XK endonuclease n=1 Tax=Clostridium botulinum TaxID=1491 RepID=UPI0004D38618|nr:group I intron-associated PD-(D/E)XK endonuclease [Clostridium botulinum]KEI05974.1 hypothetical protein Z952_04845 [Clostridium botulinum C/D str. BKT75002]KEI11283.1 hypothetical protein Z954_08800 [Clostridium botulinum C/D str. BKT2873]QPW59781.1 hypothetical protein IG390_08515 [Clostridium botulinum]QPW62260.1 hypothetical protein IG390_15140 [Clostridium phage CWou-2020b]
MARKNTDRKVRETDKDFNETSKEGSIREMFATIKLMQEGYRVSIPTVDNRYDLIAEKYPEFI